MDYLSICQIISIYGVIFFTYLSIAMAANPQHFEFTVSNEIINTSIIVCVLYGVTLIATSLMKGVREKKKRNEAAERRNLMSSDEDFQ